MIPDYPISNPIVLKQEVRVLSNLIVLKQEVRACELACITKKKLILAC